MYLFLSNTFSCTWFFWYYGQAQFCHNYLPILPGFIDFIVDPSFQVMGDMLERIVTPLQQRNTISEETPFDKADKATSTTSLSSRSSTPSTPRSPNSPG